MLNSQDIVNYVNAKVGQAYPSGYCLRFVEECYQNLGATRPYNCCAYKSGSNYIVSTSSSNIPLGATVYFGQCGGGPCKTCGATYYGHVGIYVGDGMFVHATGGTVQKSYLSSWSSKYRGYGYCGNFTLSNISVPTSPSIDKNQIWYDIQDTIVITAHADGATSYYMSMFKDDQRIYGQNVDEGKFTLAASTHGLGHYAAYFSCTNSAGSVDTQWIDFDVVGPATVVI